MGKKKKIKIILILIGILAGVFAGGFVWYVNDYYHSVDVDKYLESSDTVQVKNIGGVWFFDGTATEQALIFYPGAKVEATAYAPLMYRLAEQGIDCFLVKMPCNLAIFGVHKADQLLEDNNSYSHWYLAGHSLGGAMAADYAAGNSDKLDALILLAAYPTKDLSNTKLSVLSLYGSEDQVVNMQKIEQGRGYMPKSYEELCIQGGNHAQFGSYGIQKKDGKAQITREEQIEKTVEMILKLQ